MRPPWLGYTRPEASYLAWLDFRETGLGDDPGLVILDRDRVLGHLLVPESLQLQQQHATQCARNANAHNQCQSRAIILRATLNAA